MVKKDRNNPLGIKMGTKDEVLWTAVRDSSKNRIKNCEEQLIIERALLELAKDKILLEQRK